MRNKEYSSFMINMYRIGIDFVVAGAVVLIACIIAVANKIYDLPIDLLTIMVIGFSSLFLGMFMIGVIDITAKIISQDNLTKQQFTTRLWITGGISLICITFAVKSIIQQTGTDGVDIRAVFIASFIGLGTVLAFLSFALARFSLRLSLNTAQGGGE